MAKSVTSIYFTEVLNGNKIQLTLEDCSDWTRCCCIWKLDDNKIDGLLDSLSKTIKEVCDIIGHSRFGEDLIKDARRKSNMDRSTKDFLAEMMCITLKQWREDYGI